MSRLTEIIENHGNLEQLFAILRHYGVNAEFVSGAILNEFQDMNEEEADESTAEVIEDLTQFYARF